jgi:hypothetical protein
MLSAYFDDSGTHDSAEIVVYGGLVGTDAQWAQFERAWKAKLDQPLPGKAPLERFHMSRCMARRDKIFGGYSEIESETLAGDLTQIIFDSGVSGYACAIPKADWDALITGPMREVLGDAERNCVTNCIISTLKWARKNSGDGELAFVFDNRPHRTQANERIFSIFQRHFLSGEAGPPESSIAFEASAKFVPLQGADIVAWEFYHRVSEYHKGAPQPARPNFLRLLEADKFKFNFLQRDGIEKTATLAGSHKMIGAMANLINQPTRVFPPSLRVRLASGTPMRLEPVVSGGPQWLLGLSQKRWRPIDPFQGSEPWPHPPLLRQMTPEPSRSEENPTENQS